MIIVSSAVLTMSGCASRSTDSGFFPEEGLSVRDIYRQTLVSEDNREGGYLKKRVRHQAVNYKGYTRDAQNENKRLFKAKKNPLIPIYIYPHVAHIGDEEVAKPGYTTSFKLYKKNHYAFKWERY